MLFTVVIHKDATSDFGVIVPDLPGCFSAGDTFDDALAQAREAIALHIEGMLADNEMIPVPQKLEKHRANPEFTTGVFESVDVDIEKLKHEAACAV